jgi:hypothetical protein
MSFLREAMCVSKKHGIMCFLDKEILAIRAQGPC